MTIGTVLVGIAAASAVAAYLARPFRIAGGTALDGRIEAWIAEARAAQRDVEGDSEELVTAKAADDSRVVNYCHECGQRVEPDDRFCSGCGTRLRSGRGA